MQDMTWKRAIFTVLKERMGEETSIDDIVQTIVACGYRTSVGKTPPNTVSARMSQVMQEYGVQKVRQGVYVLPLPKDEEKPLMNKSEEPGITEDTIGATTIDATIRTEVWKFPEAEAHLMQILRLAQVDGPQYVRVSQMDNRQIEGQETFVIVPEKVWREKNPPQKPLGKWLLENMPKGIADKEPEYDESGRFIAFSDVVFGEEE